MPRKKLPYPIPRAKDLFGEVPVLQSELIDWVCKVAPHTSHSEDRMNAYIRGYNVAGKIQRAKLDGNFWKMFP